MILASNSKNINHSRLATFLSIQVVQYNLVHTTISFSSKFHLLLNAAQRSSSLINREKRTVRTEFHYLARETQHTRIMLAITQALPNLSLQIHNSEPTPSPLGYKVIGYSRTQPADLTLVTTCVQQGKIHFQGKKAIGPSCINRVPGLPEPRLGMCVVRSKT